MQRQERDVTGRFVKPGGVLVLDVSKEYGEKFNGSYLLEELLPVIEGLPQDPCRFEDPDPFLEVYLLFLPSLQYFQYPVHILPDAVQAHVIVEFYRGRFRKRFPGGLPDRGKVPEQAVAGVFSGCSYPGAEGAFGDERVKRNGLEIFPQNKPTGDALHLFPGSESSQGEHLYKRHEVSPPRMRGRARKAAASRRLKSYRTSSMIIFRSRISWSRRKR